MLDTTDKAFQDIFQIIINVELTGIFRGQYGPFTFTNLELTIRVAKMSYNRHCIIHSIYVTQMVGII